MKTLRVCNDKQEWDDYILDNGGHPLQLWGWGELKAANGWSADRLFLTDDSGQISGAVQVLYRKLVFPFRSLAYIPRGPIVDSAERESLLGLLTDYVKKNRHSVSLMIEPDWQDFVPPAGWIKSKNHILVAQTVVLDLKKSAEGLKSAMETSTRRYIRKSSESSLVIKKVSSREGLEDCLTVYRETAKRAKFNLHSDKYYYDVSDKLEDSSVLFVAYSESKPVAFLWLAVSADIAYELYGGMNDDGRKLSASYGLKWHAINKCKEWGIRRYDFGGLVDGGVTGFKKSWTNEITELSGAFEYPLSIKYGLWSFAMPMGKVMARKSKALLSKK